MTQIRFSEVWGDNVAMHGLPWTLAHYRKRGMPLWEALLWVRIAPGLTRFG